MLGGRGRAIISTKSRPIVDQITRIVAANETLQRENAALRIENDRLSAELRSIGDALDGLTTVSDRSASQRPDSDRSPLAMRRLALATAREIHARRATPVSPEPVTPVTDS